MALIFETTWHFFSHATEHSYVYGHLHDDLHKNDHNHHGGIHHVRLFKEVRSRMGGEFMSLGFLAFSIFVSNQLGFFEMLAVSFQSCGPSSSGSSSAASATSGSSSLPLDDSCWQMPATAGDWLHMAEVVHVKLFLAMMLYFVLIVGLVRGSVRKIKNWERLRLRHVVDTQRQTHDTELRDYRVMRDYFLQRVYSWKRTRPGFFQDVLNTLGIEPGLLSTKASIQQLMDERFIMSAYLSLNVERNVRDSIEVSTLTWVSIILVFGTFAIASRYLQWTILGMTPFFIAFAFITLVSMVLLSRWMKGSIHRYISLNPLTSESSLESDTASPPSLTRENSDKGRTDQFDFAEGLHSNLTISGRLSLDETVLRVLQLLMFMISYAFSRTIADKNDWTQFPMLTLLSSSLFAVLFMLLLYIIPKYVPKFLELMAFPPFVDSMNLHVLFAILTTDDHHQHNHGGADSHSFAGNSHGKNGGDIALVAVSELASIIGSCDPDDLSSVRETLERRMEDRGVQLPVPSTPHVPGPASLLPVVSAPSIPSQLSSTTVPKLSLPTPLPAPAPTPQSKRV
eukprot:TRINITY_DN14121_c0_g6_i2.p1 TRINITY_DN14121_c0_g6~~TRINITY_DN14121_c0_g6_i2.p1  ORF type:complete len:656 (+),score=59.22 TRINITY_DN14121_c0_g6_i2:268-1968(+)